MDTLDRILKSIALLGSAIALSACSVQAFRTDDLAYVEASRGTARAYAYMHTSAPCRDNPALPQHITPARPVPTSNVECNQYSRLDGTCLLLCNEIYFSPDGRRSLSDPFEMPCE